MKPGAEAEREAMSLAVCLLELSPARRWGVLTGEQFDFALIPIFTVRPPPREGLGFEFTLSLLSP